MKLMILCKFDRASVERGDFSEVLRMYSPNKLPSGDRLRAMMGSLCFYIDGYDHDPRELHTIPEVRRFYRAFHAAWPFWLYFCNLNQDGLKIMSFSCLTSYTTFKVDGRSDCAVRCDPLELARFIAGDFAPMNALCERAGMAEREIYERTKAVMEFFGFPFDASLPE